MMLFMSFALFWGVLLITLSLSAYEIRSASKQIMESFRSEIKTSDQTDADSHLEEEPLNGVPMVLVNELLVAFYKDESTKDISDSHYPNKSLGDGPSHVDPAYDKVRRFFENVTEPGFNETNNTILGYFQNDRYLTIISIEKVKAGNAVFLPIIAEWFIKLMAPIFNHVINPNIIYVLLSVGLYFFVIDYFA